MGFEKQMGAVLMETTAALRFLRTEELEELERRAVALQELHGAGGLKARPDLLAQRNALRDCLDVTETNLAVLRRILKRDEVL